MAANSAAFLAATVKTSDLAIPLETVQEVVSMPPVTPVPAMPPHVRGVINLRGAVIRLLDLRVLLGLASLADQFKEIDAILTARLEDHQRWIAELEASIRESRPFKLARNPHLCAFGKWYDTFKPQNDTITFHQFWRSFDQPHQRIHALADAAMDLAAGGKMDRALALIEEKRHTELATLVGLFTQAGQVMHETARELAVVLQQDRQLLAVSVDRVDTVVSIDAAQVESVAQNQAAAACPLVQQVVKFPGGANVRLLLSVNPLFAGMAA